MKRLYIISIFLFGLAIACDEPYENVLGYKLGCDFQENVGFYTENGKPGEVIYKKDIDDENPLVSVAISTVDNIAVSLSATLFFENSFKAEGFLKELRERWGKEILFRDELNAYSSFFKNIGSDVVSSVLIDIVGIDGGRGRLVLVNYHTYSYDQYFNSLYSD